MVAGVVGLLAGYSTGIEQLEFPLISAPMLALPFVGVAIACFIMYARKKSDHTYVSQWYLLAVVIWFPILYLTAIACCEFGAVSGVAQGIANWWYGHNVIGLFVTPTAVATAYYLIPKVIGKPVHSYHLSLLGFWSLAIFYNWAGTHHLTGGPIPAWTVTVGTVGSLMMFIPVITVAINHHMTMLGSFHLLRTSPTLRFTVFGSMMYTFSSFQGSLESLRAHQEITHFTHYTIGHSHLGLYGFYSMIMFAAMYYVMPRLTGNEWSSALLIRIHFWTAALGTLFYGGALCWSGWWQGVMMKDPSVPFLQIVEYTKPYLIMRSLSGTLLFAGTIAFGINFIRMLQHHRFRFDRPTLFTSSGNWGELVRKEKEAAARGAEGIESK
jgi:cytochrome c oxidase cbb3-type subunit 1